LSRVKPPPATKGGVFYRGPWLDPRQKGVGGGRRPIRVKRIQRLRPFESNGLEPLDADQAWTVFVFLFFVFLFFVFLFFLNKNYYFNNF
jgi:hypothetical protein